MTELDRWRQETKTYTDRIASLQLVTEGLQETLLKFPGLLSFAPTEAGSIRHRALILVNQTLYSATEILRSTQFLWSHSYFLASAHCIRLLLEEWGLLAYMQAKVLNKLATDNGEKVADQRLKRLLLGTKSGPLLPAGITEKIPAINVRDFIRAGEKAAPGLEGSYSLLCDVSHPSIMHFDLVSLTQNGSWANPVFAREAHRMLEKITSSAESAVEGIRSSAESVYQQCLPKLQAEIDQHGSAA